MPFLLRLRPEGNIWLPCCGCSPQLRHGRGKLDAWSMTVGAQVWVEMTDFELEDRLFTYFWLSFHTPNTHAGR